MTLLSRDPVEISIERVELAAEEAHLRDPSDPAAGAAATTEPLVSGTSKTQTAQPPRRLRRILNLDDFEAAARRHLPRPVFGYISAAAETNSSYRRNRDAFADYEFVPRVLVGVADRTTRTSLPAVPAAA